MHTTARLYEEVLQLMQEEVKALEEDNLDRVDEICARRSKLQNQAWQGREGCSPEALQGYLTRVLELQRHLQQLAEDLQTKTRSQFSAGQKQRKILCRRSSPLCAVAKIVLLRQGILN